MLSMNFLSLVDEFFVTILHRSKRRDLENKGKTTTKKIGGEGVGWGAETSEKKVFYFLPPSLVSDNSVLCTSLSPSPLLISFFAPKVLAAMEALSALRLIVHNVFLHLL